MESNEIVPADTEPSCSRDISPENASTVVEITENMMKEEESLQQATDKTIDRVSASSASHEFSDMVVSQRYARLQHLLNKSGIYSKILLKKMEDQREENKKKRAGSKKKKKSKASSKNSNKQDGDRSKDKDTSVSAGIVTRGRGRKRKATEETYQLSEFMNSKGKLRKRPKLEKDCVSQTDNILKNNDKTEEETEPEKERYFEGKQIPIGQPKLVSGGIMRPYQLEGTEWLKVLYENGVNGILADEMGLGKTIQCIALIAHLVEMGVKGPYLVVAPLSTVPNWVAEFKRFTPEIPVVLYHGKIEERESLRRKVFSNRHRNQSTLLPVFVTSYEVVMRDHKQLSHKEWKLLIVDEGHRIKNLNCLLIRILKSYNAGNRLLLTGTPLQNNLAELWSLLNFILPDIFDDLDNFQSWFDFGSVIDDVEGSTADIISREKEGHILSTLHEILTPFLLRRLKSDVELNIPPKKEILVYAPLTPLQEKYYTSILTRSIQQLLDNKKRETLKEWGVANGSHDDKENTEEEHVRVVRRRKEIIKILDDNQFETMLEEGVEHKEDMFESFSLSNQARCSIRKLKMTCPWVMLRKCCTHPYLIDFPLLENGELKIDKELITSCGKMLLLDQMLTALLEQGHKVLIFSQMTQLLDILEDFMDMKQLRYARLDGATKFGDRITEMARFKESPDCNIFLLSTRAGGLGINLTAADTVIIYDSDWNPQADLQAQDRCHRIGQTNPVIIYRFVTANTIDQRIVERATGKRRLEKMVIHKDKFKGYNKSDATLSIDDLFELLHSVDHDNIVNTQQVLSESALEAILDRSFGQRKLQNCSDSENTVKKHNKKHCEFFKVVEEAQDNDGTALRSINDNTTEVNNECTTSKDDARSNDNTATVVERGATTLDNSNGALPKCSDEDGLTLRGDHGITIIESISD